MDIRAHSDPIRDKALEGRKYIKITAAPVRPFLHSSIQLADPGRNLPVFGAVDVSDPF
jgi:hypothetical protein